ncbi:hypothetical protein A2382_03495 [Candidatus Woesebacteria bacterium RIFOXYB1_FULL_38_16]|uniref:Uncharacterized protein n=1 Tax=Candidatus Woesebacteria bacterium RIFOXYB1_FULL_38_16 TaxID=1802538 RepID=A0A1F8CRP7_9BACT|nr:MAG: hypothetical protein A2191_01590 [Candidatus Woesebacteria bacterium RIFOXYA1_FULL_38_9]OGM78931.1 MAG: hypothetical protein A2382_03495 [Candidatus Woesebacteria bacterium RIFOXYB1_FULL_38_16]
MSNTRDCKKQWTWVMPDIYPALVDRLEQSWLISKMFSLAVRLVRRKFPFVSYQAVMLALAKVALTQASVPERTYVISFQEMTQENGNLFGVLNDLKERGQDYFESEDWLR